MDDVGRFRDLFEPNRDAVFRICCCYLRDPEDRRDAFQEVALRVYQHASSFRGQSSPRTWVYRITVNTCLDLLRAAKRRSSVLDAAAGRELAEMGDSGAASDRLRRALDVERLYDAIALLSPIDRVLISLYLEDASTREMADVTGMSESNVRVRLHRSREVLKQRLEGTGHGTR
jgi:RNA polymerase sigma-70 factor (ECF subfamily)